MRIDPVTPISRRLFKRAIKTTCTRSYLRVTFFPMGEIETNNILVRVAEQLFATMFKVLITALSIPVAVVPRRQRREGATQRTTREVLAVRKSAWAEKVNKGGLSSPGVGFSPMETLWSTKYWRWGRREIKRYHFPGSVLKLKISRDCNA